MKAILMSDRAYWCMLMMNKKKTVEVRKGTALYKATQKLIDEYGFAEFYVYCTKDKSDKETLKFMRGRYGCMKNYDPYGKVIFKFRCYNVEEIGMWNYSEYGTKTLMEDSLCIYSCLDYFELKNYIKEKPSTAIHISDLEIFDKPKELSEFRKIGKYCKYQGRDTYCDYCSHCDCIGDELTKAPQSYMFIETGE